MAWLRAVAIVTGVFLILPLLVVVSSGFTDAAFVSFPPQGFSLRWFGEAFANPVFRNGLALSAILAVVASLVSTLVGLVIGRAVTHSTSRFAGLVVGVFTMPLLVPTLIFAVASVQFWSILGFRLNLTTLIVGHVIITIPYAIRTLTIAYQAIDPRLEEAAASLGAGTFTIFRRIVFRAIAPGIVSSIAFTALLSFDDVVVSLFLAPPSLQPLPVAMFTYLEQSVTPAQSALSVVVIAVSLVLIILLERLVGLGSLFGVPSSDGRRGHGGRRKDAH